VFPEPHPQQIEFARLNLSYTVMSKRKLLQLVNRVLSVAGMIPACPPWPGCAAVASRPRHPGFCERIGVAKANSIVDYALLSTASGRISI